MEKLFGNRDFDTASYAMLLGDYMRAAAQLENYRIAYAEERINPEHLQVAATNFLRSSELYKERVPKRIRKIIHRLDPNIDIYENLEETAVRLLEIVETSDSRT